MSFAGLHYLPFCRIKGGDIINMNIIKSMVFTKLKVEYYSRGADFYFKPNRLKIEGIGKMNIGRACSTLKKEGKLIRRNEKQPSPPVYKTKFGGI